MNVVYSIFKIFKKKIKLGIRLMYLLFNYHHGYDRLTLDCKEHNLNVKPGNLGIFTQTFNEGELLLFWEKYYGKIVGYENLYVLNNGGNDDSCGRLNPKTTVVNMPGGLVDLHNLAQMNGYFQRFLLLKYNWVLKVDVDEFMVFEDDVIEKLNALSPGIYSPEMAVAVVHDKNKESPFDYSKPLFEQRGSFVEEWPVLKKPSLASTPATWTPGNHLVYENASELPGMWMIHLHYLDYARLFARNVRFALMKPTALSRQITKAFSEFDEDTESITINELDARLSEKLITLPTWISSKF
jgi:hypothetical protein